MTNETVGRHLYWSLDISHWSFIGMPMYGNGMTQINPFAPALASTPQAQRLAAADRDAQLRKAALKTRTSGYNVEREDEFVESADAVQPSDDREQPQQQDPKHKKHHEEADGEADKDPPHLDVQA